MLFVDLVGFTQRSDGADPEDVRALLRPYFALLRQEIEGFGGIVEKFVGDAVVGAFGTPVAHEDDPERAVRAALRIAEAVADVNAAMPGLGLRTRAAVNTGDVMVVHGAGPESGVGVISGDVVNTAARLQEAAPIGGVVVGASTYLATRAAIEYQEMEPVTVKGKVAPVPAWRAVATRAFVAEDVSHTPRTPLVGREHEVTLLQSCYLRMVRDSATQFVTVTGEPGVGKSRLVNELARFVDGRPELIGWRQGRCLPYGRGITFWAFSEIVRSHLGVRESDSSDEVARKLDTTLHGLFL